MYPEVARRAGIEGTVFVQFVVGTKGFVWEPVAVRSRSEALSEEAVRLVSTSRFEPGLQRGQAVCARFTIPVRFSLR